MQGKEQEKKGWLFSETIGNGISPEEEQAIFAQLQDMKGGFENPRDFVVNVLERVKLTEDVEKKILLTATAGKIVGFFG